MKAKFNEGDLVFLRADPKDFDEGQCPANEIAEVLEHEGTGIYMVCVPKKFRTMDHHDDPDGLRELDEGQMVLIARAGKVVK